jgi:hypothetical protein
MSIGVRTWNEILGVDALTLQIQVVDWHWQPEIRTFQMPMEVEVEVEAEEDELLEDVQQACPEQLSTLK